ncbi:MAG: hypothetical protein JWR10_4808 [Rubritepida sp.]|nr:hypothetical protein [Rubritepida sp.]
MSTKITSPHAFLTAGQMVKPPPDIPPERRTVPGPKPAIAAEGGRSRQSSFELHVAQPIAAIVAAIPVDFAAVPDSAPVNVVAEVCSGAAAVENGGSPGTGRLAAVSVVLIPAAAEQNAPIAAECAVSVPVASFEIAEVVATPGNVTQPLALETISHERRSPNLVAVDNSLTGAKLAALAKRLSTFTEISSARLREMRSALNTIAKGFGLPLDMVPADPVQLRALLYGLTPAMAGVSHDRWVNSRSLLCNVLGHYDARFLPSRFKGAPAPAWGGLLALLGPDKGMRFELARFARYCTRYSLLPVGVTDQVIATYLDDLMHHSLVNDPARAARDVARFWNAAAKAYSAWPQQHLTVADNLVRRSLPWEAYPASMQVDAEAWVAWRQNTDPSQDRDDDDDEDERKLIRPATAEGDMKNLRIYLGALVEAGIDPAVLVDLRAAFTISNIKAVRRVIRARTSQERSSYLTKFVAMTKVIGRHYLKLPPEFVKRIIVIAKSVQPTNDGMTEKNKTRMRPFEDRQVLKQLIRLPLKIRDEVLRAGKPTKRLAQQLQAAVAINILLVNPLRIRNLAELRIGQSLIAQRDGSFAISLRPGEVKNSVAIESGLTNSTADMIHLYIGKYRPLLGAPGTDWLFPGQKAGCHKTFDGLRDQVQKAAAKRAGVLINPHLFRHLMAFITLTAKLGDYASVARALGHKSTATAFRYYTGLETKAFYREYVAIVTAIRDDDDDGPGAFKALQRDKRERARKVRA